MRDSDSAAWRRHEGLFRRALPELERHELSAPTLAREIAEELATLGLFPEPATLDKHVPQLVVFTYLCAPRRASARALRAAARFLYIFFLYNDYWQELRPGAQTTGPEAARRRTFIERWLSEITEEGARARRFIDAFELYRASLEVEQTLARRARPVTLAEYCDKRVGRYQSVATSPYIDLWELMEGLSIPDARRAVVEPLKELGVELTYIANDIGSVARDRASTNYVGLLAAELGTGSLPSALERASAVYVDKARTFTEKARSLESDARIRAYGEMVAHVTDGNLQATLLLAQSSSSGRYAPEARACLEQLERSARLVSS